MLKRLALILLLAVLTALTACTANNSSNIGLAQTALNKDKVYIIDRDGLQSLVKADGTVLFEPDYRSIAVLTDDFTHEQKYIMIAKVEPGTDQNQYGLPIDEKYFVGLYDLSGKQIKPYAQSFSYGNPVGDYLMVNDNNDCYFINLKTNQTYYHGISPNCAVSAHTLLAYFSQTKQAILFDVSLKAIKTFTDVKAVAALDGLDDYYTITNQAGMVGVINGQGNQVLPHQNNSFYAAYPAYLLTDDFTKAIDLKGRTLMRAAPGYKFSSYNGKAAVWRILDASGVVQKEYLVNLNGEIISQAYQQVMASDDLQYTPLLRQINIAGQNGQPPIYIGSDIVSQKDNQTISKADIMDATGKVLFSVEDENWGLQCVTPNCFIFTKTVTGVQYAKVINLAGQDVLPYKRDANINIINNQAGQAMPYLVESYPNSQGSILCDIYHLDGQPVLKGLNRVDYCDGQIITGSKGFNTGIMDMQGHWLYKQAIFYDLDIAN